MMELKTLLNQQDGEIKESERLIFTRDSELREGSREVEKLRLRLDEKEQSIDILKRGLAEKEHEVNIMTENIKMKLFEIRGLKKTLDNTKIESCKSLEAYQTKNRYLEAVVVRLKNDLESKSVLLRAKDKEITKANIGIQIKEGEVDGFKTLLRRLEEKFALYKQISTEREFKLAQEKKVLEENATHFETHLCQKQNEERPGTESETMDNNSQEENKREESEMKKNENLEVEMAKLAGEQIAVAMTDRIEQMVVDMNVMQAELESKRDENAKLLTDNKELMEQNKVSSKSLNNALDHVRMKRVEIRRLKALKSSADCIVGSEVSIITIITYRSSCCSIRLCSHLVPEHQCLGTGTKWCCVHTLGTQDVDMLAVPEFWRGYLKKCVFTLVPSKNRTRAPCSGTKCEHNLVKTHRHISLELAVYLPDGRLP